VVTAVAGIEPELHYRVTEEDGGASECYRGVLVEAGVRCSFEAQLFADANGAYFVVSMGGAR
jgi:hypothetical protein